MPSIIVYGPQGSGKTLQAEKLRKHFGLSEIIEWEERGERGDPWRTPHWPRLKHIDALVLTNAEPPQWMKESGNRRIFSIDQALALIGATQTAGA